ncbi:MAG TPA: RluA family pseudouridine synthase [Candidatus Peribacterales bacterium]|nr:RluA family pseudouridine synthase [Candidatus Peribacterales bacterium]
MATEHLIIESERLDQCVARFLGSSRSQAAKLIQEGCVFFNHKKMLKASKMVAPGSTVEIRERKVEAMAQKTSPHIHTIDLPVLYEDAHCLVIHKPAGFTVHPSETSHGQPTIIEILRAKHGNTLDLVHRLDKETTGCLLVSKDTNAHAKLQQQFVDRTVQKAYLAIVAGVPAEKSAMIEAPIGRSLVNRVKMSLFKTGESRDARTSYEVLDSACGASLLQCIIHTGRTHQIRVHLSAIRHPILGDTKYGSLESGKLSKEYGIASLCLHAQTLSFVSSAGKAVTVKAPLPNTFLESMEKFHLKI